MTVLDRMLREEATGVYYTTLRPDEIRRLQDTCEGYRVAIEAAVLDLSAPERHGGYALRARKTLQAALEL